MPIPGLPSLFRLAKPLTSEEGHGILERDRYCCQYCGLDGMSCFENSLVMTVDFVIPRAQGEEEPDQPRGRVPAVQCN
jgi:5-methylcytosine-specific restriction endonuclease McrA